MILAIDQGSSKTQSLIGDETGRIYGTGVAEGACHFMVGIDKAMAAVRSSVQNALQEAGVGLDRINRVSAGMAGANWPDEFRLLTDALEREFFPARATVYNDCVPALYAGTQSNNAIILCAGTSFNAAVLKDRRLVWIYNNYIERADDGGKGLADRALDFFGYDEVLPLMLDFSRGCIQKPVKDFAIAVDEEAMSGDTVALEAQYHFGVSVSRYATAALRKYDLTSQPTDIVLSGGIFKARSPVMVDAIRAQVHRISPGSRIVEAVFEPVVGALELALDASCQQEWRPVLSRSAQAFSLVRF